MINNLRYPLLLLRVDNGRGIYSIYPGSQRTKYWCDRNSRGQNNLAYHSGHLYFLTVPWSYQQSSLRGVLVY
jgi:hypothetical protein